MNAGQRHLARLRAEAAALADACTACGACYQVCPTVAQIPALAGAVPENVMQGVRDILQDGSGNSAAIAFAGACTRSGLCSDACPEKLDAAFLMRLASLRVRGAFGEPALVPTKDDPAWSARVKTFARLTMTEEEQTKWL